MSLYIRIREFINGIGLAYARLVCRREFVTSRFTGINERSVEYSFVFRHLSRLCPITILDVGSGQSALPHLMRTCGFMVSATDNIGAYWRFGMVNRHYHVIQDDITNTTLTGSYDLVTCISVLEHIREYDKAMRSMFSLLKPGGYLILTFPYNEFRYHGNVYDCPGSTVINKPHFITQAFSRTELNTWLSTHQATVVEQEFWRFYSGEYWTCGERIAPPERVRRDMPHQVTCLLIRKDKSDGDNAAGRQEKI
jgi:2-polyprenyl-3-methyl-5-hydroxy-6-metoxy-1,4-benzoquinol methylase